MNNGMPSYEELLEINTQLGERLQKLETIIQEQKYDIEMFFSAATLYRTLYMEVTFKNKIITD